MLPSRLFHTLPRRLFRIALILAFFLSISSSLSPHAMAAPAPGLLEKAQTSPVHPQATTGLSLGPEVNLSHSPANSVYSKIARSGEDLYVVWEDRLMGGDLEILFRASRNGGLGFEGAINLSQSPGLDDNYPVIFAEGNLIYVAWEEHRPPYGARDVMLAVSANGGRSFDAPLNVSASPGDSMSMDMAVALPYVYLSWWDLSGAQTGLNLARSSNGGIDFTQEHISDSVNAGRSGLAAAGKSVYLAYKKYEFLYVYSGTYTEGGGFDSVDQWAADEVDDRRCIHVAASGSDAYILYRVFRWVGAPGEEHYEDQLYWRRSSNNGVNWGAPAAIGAKSTGSMFVYSSGEAVLMDGDRLYVVWEECTHEANVVHNDVIKAAVWTKGAGWSATSLLGSRTVCGSTGNLGLAADGTYAYATWFTGAHFALSTSLDHGASWTTPSTGIAGFAPQGQIAASGTSFYFTWWQSVGENLEVYFQGGSQEQADIEIADLALIQTHENAIRFAAGKPTKLMATINNHYAVSKSIQSVISYIDSAGAHIRSETLHLNPGGNLLYLPQSPNEETGGAFIRPMEGTITVTLSLAPLVGETSEDNNMADVSGVFTETRSLSLLFRPMSVVGEPYPSCAEVTQAASEAERYLEAIYPVDDRRVFVQVSCLPVFFQPEELLQAVGTAPDIEYSLSDAVFDRLNLDRATGEVDNVLGVVSAGWFDSHEMPTVLGLAPVGGSTAVVSIGNTELVPVHELGHNYNLVDPELPLDDGDYHYVSDLRANGYWVVRGQARQNDYEFMINGLYTNGQPGGKHWISGYSFDYLLDQLAMPPISPTTLSAPAPDSEAAILAQTEAVILTQGVISQTGVAELGPWYRLSSTVDLEPGSPGQYQWESYNAGGDLLGRAGFDLDFTPPPDADVTGTLPSRAFSFRIPDLPGTQRIVLKKDGAQIAERVFSPHAPAVTLTSPNGGEMLLTGETATVTWTASDEDGDLLAFLLELSPDNGVTWSPLDIDVTGSTTTFTVPENILSDQVLVRVTATDGVNTASDVSDAPFSMRRNPEVVGCFGPAVNLTESPYSSESPKIAVSGSHVYLLYSDARDIYESNANGRIVFRASHDSGQTWEDPVEIHPDHGFWVNPLIAAAGSHVYITWGSHGEPPTLVASSDYGSTFSAPVVLADVDGAMEPDLYADGDTVYVWWRNWKTGPVYLRRSPDGGATFAPAVPISGGGMGEFEMVFDGGTLHATWEDGNNLRYTRSTNSGVSFEPARTLDTFPSSQRDKTLAAAGGRVTIAVTKDVALNPNTPYVMVSLDGGVSFQPPVVVDSTFRDIHRPTLVVNGEEVHFFYSKWEDLPGTGVGIQYSVSRDGGETFSAPSQLSSHGPFTYFHQELAFGSQVWSFFNEQYNDFLGDLVLRASTDGGLSFGLPRLISADAYHSVSPEDFSIYNLNGTVLLSWMKKIPAPEPGMYDAADIFFARSIDCGLGNTELVNPIPAPPVLDEITVPVLQEGLTTEITVTASDPNYDALFFTGSNMPDFAVLDPQSGNQARWILEPPYGSAGTYPDVTVTVSDGVLTASQGITLRILASNQPPLARSSGPYTAPEGGELILDGSNSFDPEGGALVARWLLQGQSYDGLSVRVPVTDNFMEPVTLTVRDTFLYERSAEDLVQVYNLPPSVAVDRQGNRLASFTDPGTLDTHTATVDWGDGSPPEAAAVTESSGSGTVSGTHGYATSGTYTVTVTVRDKDGGLGTVHFSTTTAQNLYLPCVINR